MASSLWSASGRFWNDNSVIIIFMRISLGLN